MVAGWLLVLATVVLLVPGASQMSFILVSLIIQLVGLVFVARSHLRFRDEKFGEHD